jgi:hypothetical protein
MIVQYIEKGPSEPVPPSNPGMFVDDFSVSGNMNVRTGWTVATRPGFSSQSSAITASGGFAGGTTGSAAFALRTAQSVPARILMDFRTMGGAVSYVLHCTIDPVTDANRQYFTLACTQSVSGGLFTGFVTIGTNIGGTTATIGSLLNTRIEIGDNGELELGDNTLTVYRNGRAISSAITITGRGVTLNKKHGIIGNAGAQTMDKFVCVDPATDSVLRLYMPGRVAALDFSGNATWLVKGTYTGTAPEELFAEVWDWSSGSGVYVSAIGRIKLANVVAASGSFSADPVTITAAQRGSMTRVKLRVIRLVRDGNGDIIEDWYDGPLQGFGPAIISWGQSLNADGETPQLLTTATWTVPTWGWWISGKPTDISTLGADTTRQQYPMAANTTPAALAYTIEQQAGYATTLCSGGIGGTTAAARGFGTATYLAMVDALGHAGGRATCAFDSQGQSDLATDNATYLATRQAFWDGFAALNGGSIIVFLDPLSSAWATAGGTDEDWQNRRYQDWLTIYNYPSRYKLGAYKLHIQHQTGLAGRLHPSADGYGQINWIKAMAVAKAFGAIANDRSGPKLVSVTKVDAQTIKVWIDPDGADSVAIRNTGYRSEFHGGLIFSTSTAKSGGTIQTKIWPTNAVVDASPTGGLWGITFTFASNSFPGTPYVWAAYGRNPFNPFDDGTDTDAVNADMANRASMIVGVRSGEYDAPIQPSFSPTVDYVTAA